MVLPHSHDLRRRLKKSDCALGESGQGGNSPLDQRRSSSPAVCRFCTLHRRNRRISQVPRQLLAECAKTAQAHFLFRQMIAKFLCPSDASETASPLVGQRLGQIEQRHCRCSTEHRMSVGLRGSSDVGGLLCRIKRRTKSRRGRHCRPQPSRNSSQIHRAQEAWFSSPCPNF